MTVQEILHKIGYTDLKDFGKQYRTRPLYRLSDNHTSLCINKDTGTWYDYSDRRGGGIKKLIQVTLKLSSLEEVNEYLKNQNLEAPVNTKNHKVELFDTKRFDKQLLLKLKKDQSYWVKRGVSLDTLKLFEGGVTYNGRMAYRYVFPIFDDREELIGFSGRRLVDKEDDYPKWMHLGYKKSWCYPTKWNKEEILKKKSVILVESIGDMLTLWDNGIKNVLVCFGVELSPTITQFMLRHDLQKIYIALNNDFDNELIGNEAAEEMRLKLMKSFDEQQITISLPIVKDFGEMSPVQILEWKQKYSI